MIEGEDVRTGVTVVLPPAEPLFAGAHRINGNGELTGLEWMRDSGLLTTPVALTNTHSVGVVRDALVAAAAPGEYDWSLPVVGETWDGVLNDINGFHVRPEHVAAALERAAGGAVEEGAVGGGTGMVCHGFKGGIGTSSRVVEDGWTLGVLVQANHGRRARLRVNGVPVGERIGPERVPLPATPEDAGSIIVVLATDAPLLPGQCERLARRAGFGIARTGGMGERSSGDFALCFATGNRGLDADGPELSLRMLNDRRIDSALRSGDRRGRGGDRERAPRCGDDDGACGQHRRGSPGGAARRGARSGRRERHLVDVAPAPALPRLIRLDHRVPGGVEVLRRMPLRRAVAAADVAAGEAEAEVHPSSADTQAVLAARSARRHVADRVEMSAAQSNTCSVSRETSAA